MHDYSRYCRTVVVGLTCFLSLSSSSHCSSALTVWAEEREEIGEGVIDRYEGSIHGTRGVDQVDLKDCAGLVLELHSAIEACSRTWKST